MLKDGADLSSCIEPIREVNGLRVFRFLLIGSLMVRSEAGVHSV